MGISSIYRENDYGQDEKTSRRTFYFRHRQTSRVVFGHRISICKRVKTLTYKKFKKKINLLYAARDCKKKKLKPTDTAKNKPTPVCVTPPSSYTR